MRSSARPLSSRPRCASHRPRWLPPCPAWRPRITTGKEPSLNTNHVVDIVLVDLLMGDRAHDYHDRVTGARASCLA